MLIPPFLIFTADRPGRRQPAVFVYGAMVCMQPLRFDFVRMFGGVFVIPETVYSTRRPALAIRFRNRKCTGCGCVRSKYY